VICTLLHRVLSRLRRKAERQQLIPLIRRGRQIRLPFLLAHSSPPLLSNTVPPDVEKLRPNEQQDVVARNGDEHLIASAIQRLVVRPVDLRRYHIARLNGHVIQCRSNGARAHRPGVAARDGHVDGVDVGRADEEDREHVAAPAVCARAEEFEDDQEGETPKLGGEAGEEALVGFLGEPGPEEEIDDEENVGGDGEEICLEGGEIEGLNR
jgi:hypothetical protein